MYIKILTLFTSQAFVYQMTLGSVGFAAFLEVPTTRLRAKTTSLGNMSISLIQWVIGFTFPYLFNPDAANLGDELDSSTEG